MKPIMMNMSDMSESKEVYNSRPNPFFVYFIYLIVGMLAIGLIWMYFLKMDIVVKSNGMFKNAGDSTEVCATVTGKVVTSNVSEGQYVNKGDVLYTLSIDSIDDTLKVYRTSLEEINARLEILKAYQKSIDGKPEELAALSSNRFYHEFNNRSQLLQANRNATDQGTDGQKRQYQKNAESIANSIKQYENQMKQLRTVENCVRKRNNTFKKSDTYYYSLVASYISSYENMELQYDNKIKSLADDTKQAKVEKKQALANLELQQITTLEQQIETVNSTIQSLKTNLSSVQAQIEALSGTDTQLAGNITVMTEKGNVAAELLTYEGKKKECETNLKEIEDKNGQSTIKATESGYISLSAELKQGAYVQQGTPVCKVLPDSNEYYAEVYMDNSGIGKLKEGQNVKFEIPAYPSSEYGFFTGNIESISKDIKVDSTTGSAFYIVKVKCDKTTVTNKKGESGSVINGMACQAKVVVDEQSVLRYLLEKIDLID